MALQKITNKEIEEKQVASLPDRMTGTAAENKAAFDALVKAVIEKYNEVIETLSGISGAGSIGAEPFAGVEGAATVQEQLQKLQENIASAVAGSIPDASITTAKIADQAITTRKLAANAVTETEIKDAEITDAKIRDLAILTAKLADGAVTAAKLADGAVTTAKLADGAVTIEKTTLQNIVKSATGTYVGTGTKGSSNPCSLTFGFKPLFLAIHSETVVYEAGVFHLAHLTSSYLEHGYRSCTRTGSSFAFYSANYAKISGNTVSWYNASDVTAQLNTSDVTYSYFVLGV